MAKAGKIKDLEKLPDEEILNMRIRDLGIQIQGSELQPLIDRLYGELDAKGICFHPPCYLTDEWLCPDKIPIIGIPFYLAHPRLKQIEKKMMYEVEGGTEESCMKLLRHECGHALNYAYELYKKTRWRELFGSFSTRYSDSYYFRPYSRRYVINLQDNYAQSHPDEDFAETFAVWLAPHIDWELKYRNWPVIKKLWYVDGLMKRISTTAPVKTVHGQPPWPASRMTSSLAAHYERKRRALGSEFQGFYDDSLITLFALRQSSSANPKASKFLRQHRRELIDSVARWTGHRKHDIHQLVNTLIFRCDVLNLYARSNQMEEIVGITALLTAIASNTLRIVGRHIR
jgi:hypothetical protein